MLAVSGGVLAGVPARISHHWYRRLPAKLLAAQPRGLQALSQASGAFRAILTPCSLRRMVSLAQCGAKF